MQGAHLDASFRATGAVVTDGGTLAAHASLVARKYGIPAVVRTADAAVRLRDRQMVLVDARAGFTVRSMQKRGLFRARIELDDPTPAEGASLRHASAGTFGA